MSLPQEQLFSESGQEQLQEWFSVKELAGKPGLGLSGNYILKKAKRERWSSRKTRVQGNIGTGKRVEFHISSLPTETRISLGWPDPAGKGDPFGSRSISDHPTDVQAYGVMKNLAAAIKREIPTGALPNTGIHLVVTALQDVYGTAAIRRVFPGAIELRGM